MAEYRPPAPPPDGQEPNRELGLRGSRRFRWMIVVGSCLWLLGTAVLLWWMLAWAWTELMRRSI